MSHPDENQRVILVVDDDDDIRAGLTDALEMAGYRVVCAQHGGEALAILRTSGPPPAVVLLDMVMSVMDGPAFLAERAHDPGLIGIPVLLMTAGPTRIDPAWKVDAAISKPLRTAALLRAVADLC